MEAIRTATYVNLEKVRFDKRITPRARILFGEIVALSNSKGYCYADNFYFAALYNVTTVTVSRWVSALVRAGYITRSFIYKKGRKEIAERRIYVTRDSMSKSYPQAINKNENDRLTEMNSGIDENVKENITKNTTSNNIDDDSVEEALSKFKEASGKEEIINHKRRSKLKALIKKYGEVKVLRAIKNIEESDYLIENIELSWFLVEKNFIKVWKGNYKNREKKAAFKSSGNNGTQYGPTKFHNFKQVASTYTNEELEQVWSEDRERDIEELKLEKQRLAKEKSSSKYRPEDFSANGW